MAHETTRGDSCVYKDGHKGQHRAHRNDEYDQTYNRTHGARNAARYRNRNPVKRALTIAAYNAKNRVSA